MSDIEQWKQEQEQNALYTLRAQDSSLSKLLESGVGNRTITVKQATMISRLKFIAGRTQWKWLSLVCESVEDYQGTIDTPTNNRLQFIDAIKFKEYSEHEKSKLITTIAGNGAVK